MVENGGFNVASRLESFRCAFHGVWTLLASQQNARIHLLATVCACGLGLWIRISLLEWCAIVVAIVMVWTAEALNTAFEFLCDVTSPEFPDRLAAELDLLGGPELCVYAAGIGEFLDVQDLSAQTRVLEVNLIGAVRTAELVLPRMVAAGAGQLIGLSSLADVMVSAQAPGYAASKAGLSAYFRGLAPALRPHGVAVTTVRFGFVDTKMAKADRTPAMMSVPDAVDVLIHAITHRPVRVSRPRRAALAVGLATIAAALRP